MVVEYVAIERVLQRHSMLIQTAGGFFGNKGANSSYEQYDLVIIPEVDPFNNTLASYDSCPGDMSEGWVVPKYIYSPINHVLTLLSVINPRRSSSPDIPETLWPVFPPSSHLTST